MFTLTISTTTQHQGIKGKLAHKKNAEADADDDGSDDDADDEDSDDDDFLPSASSSSVPQFVKSDPRFDFLILSLMMTMI